MRRLALIAVFLAAALPAAALADTVSIQTYNGTTPVLTGTAHPMPVTGTVTPAPAVVTPTDRGGTITVGGTAQTLAAANSSRKALVVQNPCNATEDLYISVTGNATVGGAGDYADLPACASAVVGWNGQVITAAVSVNAATAGHRWYATETQ